MKKKKALSRPKHNVNGVKSKSKSAELVNVEISSIAKGSNFIEETIHSTVNTSKPKPPKHMSKKSAKRSHGGRHHKTQQQSNNSVNSSESLIHYNDTSKDEGNEVAHLQSEIINYKHKVLELERTNKLLQLSTEELESIIQHSRQNLTMKELKVFDAKLERHNEIQVLRQSVEVLQRQVFNLQNNHGIATNDNSMILNSTSNADPNLPNSITNKVIPNNGDNNNHIREIPMNKHEKTKREIYRKAFDKFDGDGSNFIDANELTLLLKEIGWDNSPEAVRAALEYLDVDNSEGIEFDEFMKWTDYAWKHKITVTPKQTRSRLSSRSSIALAPLAEKNIDNETIQSKTEKTKREIYRKAFDKFDGDGSNFIDANELTLLLKEIGWDNSPEAVQAALEYLDVDNSEGIEFDEFMKWADYAWKHKITVTPKQTRSRLSSRSSIALAPLCEAVSKNVNLKTEGVSQSEPQGNSHTTNIRNSEIMMSKKPPSYFSTNTSSTKSKSTMEKRRLLRNAFNKLDLEFNGTVTGSHFTTLLDEIKWSYDDDFLEDAAQCLNLKIVKISSHKHQHDNESSTNNSITFPQFLSWLESTRTEKLHGKRSVRRLSRRSSASFEALGLIEETEDTTNNNNGTITQDDDRSVCNPSCPATNDLEPIPILKGQFTFIDISDNFKEINIDIEVFVNENDPHSILTLEGIIQSGRDKGDDCMGIFTMDQIQPFLSQANTLNITTEFISKLFKFIQVSYGEFVISESRNDIKQKLDNVIQPGWIECWKGSHVIHNLTYELKIFLNEQYLPIVCGYEASNLLDTSEMITTVFTFDEIFEGLKLSDIFEIPQSELISLIRKQLSIHDGAFILVSKQARNMSVEYYSSAIASHCLLKSLAGSKNDTVRRASQMLIDFTDTSEVDAIQSVTTRFISEELFVDDFLTSMANTLKRSSSTTCPATNNNTGTGVVNDLEPIPILKGQFTFIDISDNFKEINIDIEVFVNENDPHSILTLEGIIQSGRDKGDDCMGIFTMDQIQPFLSQANTLNITTEFISKLFKFIQVSYGEFVISESRNDIKQKLDNVIQPGWIECWKGSHVIHNLTYELKIFLNEQYLPIVCGYEASNLLGTNEMITTVFTFDEIFEGLKLSDIFEIPQSELISLIRKQLSFEKKRFILKEFSEEREHNTSSISRNRSRKMSHLILLERKKDKTHNGSKNVDVVMEQPHNYITNNRNDESDKFNNLSRMIVKDFKVGDLVVTIEAMFNADEPHRHLVLNVVNIKENVYCTGVFSEEELIFDTNGTSYVSTKLMDNRDIFIQVLSRLVILDDDVLLEDRVVNSSLITVEHIIVKQ